VARALSFPGKSAHYVHKQIPKHFSLKRVDLLAKQNEFVFPAMFVLNVLNTLSHMMSDSEFGVDSPSESDVDLSVDLLNRFSSIN
jgi:uncharacterized protein YeeX (DUF496 family)